jgi:hypothetical protein
MLCAVCSCVRAALRCAGFTPLTRHANPMPRPRSARCASRATPRRCPRAQAGREPGALWRVLAFLTNTRHSSCACVTHRSLIRLTSLRSRVRRAGAPSGGSGGGDGGGDDARGDKRSSDSGVEAAAPEGEGGAVALGAAGAAPGQLRAHTQRTSALRPPAPPSKCCAR